MPMPMAGGSQRPGQMRYILELPSINSIIVYNERHTAYTCTFIGTDNRQDQDGGIGSKGTVYAFRDREGQAHGFEMNIPNLTAVVKWDSGRRFFYSIGAKQAYFLSLA